MDDEKPNSNMEIRVDGSTVKGVYCNSFVLSSSPTEITLDFIYQNYQQNVLQSRVILHPDKAAELLQLLEKQLVKYRMREDSKTGSDTPIN